MNSDVALGGYFLFALYVLIWIVRDQVRRYRTSDRSVKLPPINVDQFTAERRRSLAQLNHPAPKGFTADHRATVTRLAQRRTK